MVGPHLPFRGPFVKYDDFLARSYLTQEEILAMTYGRLIDDPPEGFKI